MLVVFLPFNGHPPILPPTPQFLQQLLWGMHLNLNLFLSFILWPFLAVGLGMSQCSHLN